MNLDKIVYLALASLAFAGCADDTSPEPHGRSSTGLTVQEDSELGTRLQRGLDRLHAGGVIGVVARVSDGEHRIDARSGQARQGSAEPVAFESQFRMGSTTKTFVAVVILQLVDEGKVRLEDTVDRWLPGTVSGHGNDGKKVSIRNLLQHTSGLYNYTEDMLSDFTAKDYYVKRFRHADPEELVAIAVAHEPDFAPGAGWNYSNTNYILAGMIIEKATGRDWSTEVRTRIMEPLHMSHTFELAGGERDRHFWPCLLGSALLNIGTRYSEGFTDYRADAFDALTIACNAFDGSAVWQRGASIIAQGTAVS